MQSDLLKDSYKILIFSLPIIMSAMINMASGFVAMLMVAQLGHVQLAAGALAISTFIPILTVSVTVFYSISILISHYKGAKKSAEEIGYLVKNGFWLAAMMIVPVIVLLHSMDKVLLLFKQDPQLVVLTTGYFHFAALTMIPNLAGSVIMQFYTGIGKPKFAFFIALMTLLPTIALSYILILGKFGFPVLGLTGITAANFIMGSLTVTLILFYMYFQKNLSQYKIFSGKFWPDLSLCKKLFMLGMPIGIQFGAELSAMAAATYMMGHYGVSALAASQISSQYAMLLVMVFLGISQAISVFVSEAYGKNDFSVIKQYVNAAMLILAAIFIIVIALFVLMPAPFINIYVNTADPQNKYLVYLAEYFLVIMGVLLMIDGIRNIFSGALRGMHDSATPMRIGVICMWLVSLPIAYLISFPLNGGPIGLRIGFGSGFILAVILLWRKLQMLLASKLTADKHNLVQSNAL